MHVKPNINFFSYKRDIGHHKLHEVEHTKFLEINFDKHFKFKITLSRYTPNCQYP